MDFIEGEILYFNKPLHWTSFSLVNKVRWLICKQLKIKKIKVGHAGTLDPLATGVMIICTGHATKRIETFQYQTKEYVATLFLGATTPSFDLETAVDKEFPTSHITRELIEERLQQFIGTIEQIPPVYSAVKVDGKRAYQYAREGNEVALASKTLIIDELEILSFKLPILQLRIVCSKGTYIRALARDIGRAIESGAYLTSLIRTRIGECTIDHCLTLETFEQLLKLPLKEP
jgi:tRNA pseudouridine55 synthase